MITSETPPNIIKPIMKKLNNKNLFLNPTQVMSKPSTKEKNITNKIVDLIPSNKNLFKLNKIKFNEHIVNEKNKITENKISLKTTTVKVVRSDLNSDKLNRQSNTLVNNRDVIRDRASSCIREKKIKGPNSTNDDYYKDLTKLLLASNKKGGIKKFITEYYGDPVKPINLSALYSDKKLSKNENFTIKRKKSEEYVFDIDINKLVEDRTKVRTSIDWKFDAPELNNMTLFGKNIRERFKSNILLNKYSWNKKKHIIEGKEAYTVKKIKKDIIKHKEERQWLKYIEEEFSDGMKIRAQRPKSVNKTSLLEDQLEYEKKNLLLRKEFYFDYFIANILSKKNLTLTQKKILDDIKVKFESDGKFNNLNNYYLHKFAIQEFNPYFNEIERKLLSNRDTVKALYVMQNKTDRTNKSLVK